MASDSRTSRLARITLALLAGYVGVVLYSAAIDWHQLSLIDELLAGHDVEAELLASDDQQRLTAYAFLGVLLLCAIAFLRWLGSCNRTLRELGHGDRLRQTPGWTIGYFFVPFLNLVRPYQGVGDLWRASAPSRHDASTPALLPLWWLVYLASGFLGRAAASRLVEAEDIASIQEALRLLLLSDLVDLVAAGLAMLLVRQLTLRIEACRVDAGHGSAGLPRASAS